MKVYVIIPNWNGADLLAKCLRSLENQSQKAEIVVVDNGSVDNSIKLVKESFSKIKLIELPKNTGFSGGVNTGINYALKHTADAVALFNNDAVADEHWLKNLVDALETNTDSGIVTGKLIRSDEKHFDSTGDFYSIWGMPFPRGRNQKDEGQFDKPADVFGATGGASLYRAKMLKEIGLFDQKFFAYYEDVDISFRAQLAGWKVLYEPKAKAYHHISATSSKLGNFTRYHATKNFFLLYVKNMPGWLFWKYLPLFLIQSLRLFVSSLLKGKPVPFLKGWLKSILLLPQTLTDRHRIQSKRSVSIKHIDSILYKHRPPKIPPIS